jgi:hypothetical protein
MPPPCKLRLEVVGSDVVVSYGGRVLALYERGDRGMRNLAIVALTRAGVAGVEVAALFGVHANHVSRLRRLASEGGVHALVPPMGRPAKLDRGAVEQAYGMSDRGVAGSEIARELGVSGATISRLLARRPALEVERLALVEPDMTDTPDGACARGAVESVGVVDDASPLASAATVPERIDAASSSDDADSDSVGAGVEVPGRAVGQRIVEGGGDCVYAGAMLLHAFLDRVGASDVFGALDCGPGTAYDSTAVAIAGTFAFALGSSSLEGSKHLLLRDAGLLVGAERFPHLRTLRPRLATLADHVDPVAVQVALAKAMLNTDAEPPSVFFVDDHFVAYTGQRPVAKGWNTRRRLAEPGRAETMIVDDRWRAVCFASGAPQGLAKRMWDPIDQLQEICGERPIMIGFDRGGSYPKVFSDLRARGLDWVTYRRAPLPAPAVEARRSWVELDGQRHYLRVADEQVNLDGYGPARQISVIEHGRVALQILTSDQNTPAARLAHVLRCRWCIENTFKYMENHLGLHWLGDYEMTITPDTALVRNPQRTTGLARQRTAEAQAAELERQIGATTTSTTTDAATSNELDDLHKKLALARNEINAARAALKPIPAKLPANTINPDALHATPRTNRRALQTICRLLAYNAELDLARALNTYLPRLSHFIGRRRPMRAGRL